MTVSMRALARLRQTRRHTRGNLYRPLALAICIGWAGLRRRNA